MADYTPQTFAEALLERLGMPVTPSNMQAMTAWMRAEGGNWNNSARFNPLNTTQDEPGSTTMNSVGVRSYDSWQQGLDATVQTLQNGRYGGILNALKAGDSSQAVADAVAASPWGTGAFSPTLGDPSVPNGAQDPRVQAATGSAYYSPQTKVGAAPISVEDALSKYGFVGDLANVVPELKNLLVQGAQQGWSTTKFQQEVMDTNWWKSHAEKQRENVALKATDPAEYEHQRGQVAFTVRSLLDQMGVKMRGDTYDRLVNMAFDGGWQNPQIQQFIMSHANLKRNRNGNLVGQAGSLAVQLKEAYANYGIKYSNDTLNANVRAVLSGHSTIDGVTSQIQNAAMAAFPAIANAIKSGQTVRQIADPYIQSMGSILEIDPQSLSTYTPEIRKALAGSQDQNQQAMTPMWRFEQMLRQDPRWDHTDNARNAAFQVVHQIGQDWGFSS